MDLEFFFKVSVKDRKLPYCSRGQESYLDQSKDLMVDRTRPNSTVVNANIILDEFETDQVAWVWILIFAYATPELVGVFMRSLRMVLFKSFKIPIFTDFLFVFIMETLHVIGLVILTFLAFPQLDSAHAVVLTNCLAFIPAVLLMLSRNMKER